MSASQYVSIAPIAAGAQAYQVCWIFKASGKPPSLRWQTALVYGRAKPLVGRCLVGVSRRHSMSSVIRAGA